MQITPNTLKVSQLFSSVTEQYVIPAYQRRYSWHERQVGELLDDIRLLDNGDTHLLGSIVCLVRAHHAGLNNLELVDGQQRLTTISIILHCIRQKLQVEEDQDARDDARDIVRMLTAKNSAGTQTPKIKLDSIDSADFLKLVESSEDVSVQNEDMAAAFHAVRQWLGEQSVAEVRKLFSRIRDQAVIIRLDVSDAKDAFKLFETINNRGLPLSPTDIIKNFLLGNAARFGESPLELARGAWADLIVSLDRTNADAFFRHFLMAQLARRVTASEVVPEFKRMFMENVREASALPERRLYVNVDPDVEEFDTAARASTPELKIERTGRVTLQEFLNQLRKYARVYGELVLAGTHSKPIDRHLEYLQMIKAAPSYGFLTYLRANNCPDKEFARVLELTEALMLRRHVCRERTNDTEALFAKLCNVLPRDPVEATKKAYREYCPTDEKFREEFAAADFTPNLINRARYCLGRIEAAKHGAHDELAVLGADEVHVEHIIPQKIKTMKAKDEYGDWVTYLGANSEALHGKYVCRIGNLTLFAGELNIGASNNPFAKKKNAYKKSAIVLTKDLTRLSGFKFSHVAKRSKELAVEAVKLWPMP